MEVHFGHSCDIPPPPAELRINLLALVLNRKSCGTWLTHAMFCTKRKPCIELCATVDGFGIWTEEWMMANSVFL